MARKASKYQWHGDNIQALAWLEDFLNRRPDSYYGYVRNLVTIRSPSWDKVRSMAAMLSVKHPDEYMMWRSKRRVLGQSVPKEDINGIPK